MRWEYKTLQYKVKSSFFGGSLHTEEIENVLNQYGRAGWELVSCCSAPTWNRSSVWVIAALKKPLG
jgi:hypothetical protein